ncbi:MAG TPA: GNAT family N-acetyltransferase, partial [Bordetella sp.]
MSAVRTNEYGLPIGPELPGWSARARPPCTPIQGRFCRIEPLAPARHADDLVAAFRQAPDGRAWTYLAVGPFTDPAEHRAWLAKAAAGEDLL